MSKEKEKNILETMQTKTFIPTKDMTEEEWVEKRNEYIGGSDIAGIMGVSTYSSPLTVYTKKLAPELFQFKNEIPLHVGKALEPLCADKLFPEWIKENEGCVAEIYSFSYIIVDKDCPVFGANVDRVVYHSKYGWCGLEIKTTSAYNRDKWQDDEIPEDYYLQCQWYMGITGYKRWYIGYLIGNNFYSVKVIERDDELIRTMREKAKDFWEDYIIPQVPPEPSGVEDDNMILGNMFPQENQGEDFEIYEDDGVLREYDRLKEQITALDREMEIIKQKIKAKMKAAEKMYWGDKSITWKTTHYKEKSSPAKDIRVLRINKRRKQGVA